MEMTEVQEEERKIHCTAAARCWLVHRKHGSRSTTSHHTERRTRDSKGRAANTKLHNTEPDGGVEADDAAACGVAGSLGRG